MDIDAALRALPQSGTAPAACTEAVLLQLLAELDHVENEHQLMQTVLAAVTQVIPCRQAILYEWDEEAGQPQLCYSAATEPGFLTEYLARFRSQPRPCSCAQSSQDAACCPPMRWRGKR